MRDYSGTQMFLSFLGGVAAAGAMMLAWNIYYDVEHPARALLWYFLK